MKQDLRFKHYEDDEEVKKSSEDVTKRATNTILRGWMEYMSLKVMECFLGTGGDYVEK